MKPLLFGVLVAAAATQLLEMCQCRQNSAREAPSDNILVLIPFNTKSHKNMFVPLIKALAEKVRV
jgi:hypothetical protein